MNKFVASSILCLLLAASARAAELRFGQDGIELDAGSIGKFILDYPLLLDAARKTVHKIQEKNVAGKSAALKYEGGAQLDLAMGDGGKVLLKMAHMPPDVKVIQLDMHIPIAFNEGGKWKIGDKEGEFPKEKPAKPHLYQGNATLLKITNYEGKSVLVGVPEYSFLELTDNREWNWAIFHFKSVTPVDPGRTELTVTLNTQAGIAGAKPVPLADKFGQSAREDWPDKVKTIEELKADVEAENVYYAALHPPEFDSFGGLPGSKEKMGLQATGFFHVEKKDERWIFVDPAGNACFHLGLCAVNPSDDYTLVKGRESAYEWLPPNDAEFKTVFRKDSGEGVLSFHLVNMIRKYGKPYDIEDYSSRMIARMRKWGFNSIGAFSGGGEQARQTAQFPTVASLPLSEWEGIPRIPGIHETFDPFDEQTRAQIEANLAKSLPARESDPLIAGYFIVNEPLYEKIPEILPSLKGTFACKRRLVQWLLEKYKDIGGFNTAWEAQAKTFDELNDKELAVKSSAARQDVQEFTGVFLDEYFRIVAEAFHRHDKKHLLIGSRLQPGTINNEQLCRIAGKYLDVISFNYYTYGLDKEFLQKIYRWTGGRPMMLSEFYWPSPKDSGLAGGNEVATQQERGLAYRNYVEQAATTGFVIGIEWFTLVDQSATGRWFDGFNGERANTGVIAVTDRPWKAMLAEMMKTNYDIYKVLFGERAPFVFDNARFKNGK